MNRNGHSSNPAPAGAHSRHHEKIAGQLFVRLVFSTLFIISLQYRTVTRLAHAEPGRVEIGAHVAPSRETYDGDPNVLDYVSKQGISFGLDLRVGLSDWLSIQTGLVYATRGTNIEDQGESLGGLYFTYLHLPALARVGWRLPVLTGEGRRGPLTGYLIAGPAIGYVIGAEDVLSDGEARPVDRDDLNLNNFDISAVLGLGLNWDVTPRWAASFEVQGTQGLFNVFKDDVFTDNRTTRNRAILFTLSMHYTLNDGDSDGVADSRDRCPEEAEYWNGASDEDGCADDDPDGDGFVGKADACPDKAEDPNKYEDTDGCPDGQRDTDEDGIVDKDDKCVKQAFPYNKNLDHERRGCRPDFNLVRVGNIEFEFTPPLEFDFGEATLTDSHRRALDQVVKLLRDYYPSMQVSIEGHSDSKQGKQGQRDNQEESKRRATAVKNYLVEAGIEDGRLRIDPRGDDNPRAIETPDGRQRSNRRVDLIILENPKPAGAPPR
jgi:outer membrane protein OmpA-like peptidoglycan-associated protein